MTQMRIDQIVIGERRREDLGDIAGLAASIDKYGLIHAIVVDPAGRLIAGGRRLAACQSLGMKWVEVRQWDELSEAELREIELEENLRRKDLTESERSRTLVARVEAAREVAKESEPLIRSTTEQIRHRPMTPGSYRDVEQRTGIPAPTIKRAEQHVAAVEKYPKLETLPQATAIAVAKEVDAAPEEERGAVLESKFAAMHAKATKKPAEVALYERISSLLIGIDRYDPDEIAAAAFDDDSARRLASQLPKATDWLTRFASAIERRTSEPIRLVR